MPSDEWADGKKVHLKVITRDPIDEVDFSRLESKPLSYYVSLEPGKLATIRKTPEQLKFERKQLTDSNPLLKQNKTPNAFEKVSGGFKEYDPKIKPKNMKYVLLKDSKEEPFVENILSFDKLKLSQLSKKDLSSIPGLL